VEFWVRDLKKVRKEGTKLQKRKKKKKKRKRKKKQRRSRQGCDSEMQIYFWVCRICVGWKRLKKMKSKVLVTNSLLSSFFPVAPYESSLGDLSGEGRIEPR